MKPSSTGDGRATTVMATGSWVSSIILSEYASMPGQIRDGGDLEKATKPKSRADVLPKERGRVVVAPACV